jgi:hypothetical protein
MHKEYSVLALDLEVEGISSIKTNNVRQALVILLKENPQIFEEEKSPQDILQALGLNVPKDTKKGKWAKVAERFRKNSLGPEAAKIMEEAGREFREGFAFKHDD